MKIIEGLDHGSPQWLAWRQQGIGSSDIPAICSVCPYKSPLDIYNDKKGLSKNRRNSAMQRGIDYEDEARNVFVRSRVSQRSSWDPVNVEHEETVFKASLDGYDPYTNCILEIKIPNRKVLDMARYGQVPIHYLYQIQWQLYVTGCPKCFYFCYNPDTLESYCVEVYPDQAIRDLIYAKAVQFWHDVINGLPPPAKKPKKSANDHAAAILGRMLECKESEKIFTDIYKKLLAELIEMDGIEDGIESDSATLSVSERSSYDYKKAAEDAGVNLENYKKASTKIWVVKAK